MTGKTLLVFAHADEAAAFAREGVPHLVTGIGKVNAALELTRALLDHASDGVDRVVVLGTAGAIAEAARLDAVYRIAAVVQHDFSLPSPRLELVDGAERLPYETAVIATGDVFVQSDAQREQIAATGAILVDMEVYAYASVCRRLGVPIEVYKVPSDFADSATTMQTWDEIVLQKSEQLLEFARTHLSELLPTRLPAAE